MTPPVLVTMVTSPLAVPGEPQFKVEVLGDGRPLLEAFPFSSQDAYTWRSGVRAAFELVGSTVVETESGPS